MNLFRSLAYTLAFTAAALMFGAASSALACGPFDLEIDKKGPKKAHLGDTIEYVITLKENLHRTFSVVITDEFPDILTFDPNSVELEFTQPIFIGGIGNPRLHPKQQKILQRTTCAVSGNILTCTIPGVFDKEIGPLVIRLSFSVPKDLEICPIIKNKVSVVSRELAEAQEKDINRSNNVSFAITQIKGCEVPTPTPSPTPKVSPTPTPSPSPAPSPSPSPTPSVTPTPSPTPSPSPTPTVSPSPSPTPSPSPSPSPSPVITITNINNNNVETGDVNVHVKAGDQKVEVVEKTTTVIIPGQQVAGAISGKGVPITAPTGPGAISLLSTLIGGGGLTLLVRRNLF